MTNLVQEHRVAVNELCRRHHVHRLEVFGSAADGTFDPDRSDLDFLVEFQPLDPGAQARAYFGLLFDLEDLFHRRVDLVEIGAVSNPFFLKSVNQSRRVLYAA